ncbi:Homocysteine S-methyltransferase [Carnimonas sp. R-84981]|uniref:homocysteine S-methyltransferase n=1 Tax=Carnimonas bestiolae TaxID=3402172 RepID=UPI003EDB769D
MNQHRLPLDLASLLAEQQMLVVDGGLSNEVEAQGATLATQLWSARLLLDNPELIKRAHRAYFDAGADIAITASYQASLEGFAAIGVSEQQALELIKRSVSLAREAADEHCHGRAGAGVRPLVAGSVGPYGAYLADGSEYSGDYTISEPLLKAFHRPRIDALLDAGVDILAIETQPSFSEVVTLVRLLEDYPQARAWVTFSARNGSDINDGTPIAECAAWLDEQPQVVALGVNCTQPEFISSLLGQLSPHTCKPLVVYPNSGEHYDAQSKCWSPTAAPDSAGLSQHISEWYALGARLIGGCCRTTPSDIATIAAARSVLPPAPISSRREPTP